MDTSEKRFEQDIETYFLNHGFRKVLPSTYDKEKMLFSDVIEEFVSTTQPKAWARYTKLYGASAVDKLTRRVNTAISESNVLDVLKKGIKDMGIEIKLCYFKPSSNLNLDLVKLYEGNICGITRQFPYSKNNNNTIDTVLSINGIPLFAFELKDQLKGQDINNAMRQWKEDRDPKEPIFKFGQRFLCYFAIDLYDAFMTTELKGEYTKFLPFNQGSNGAGNPGGKGNPKNDEGYPTSYIWERVFSVDSMIDLIAKFITITEEKEEKNGKSYITKKIIFPRYHQYDVVKKILADVKEKGAGVNYLIEHSAGSGKSNSIAWIAYRLASAFDKDDKYIFDSVIIVTNRIVLDSQLQDTINSFDHKAGLVECITQKKGSRGLVDAINDKKKIIICTIQKFLYAYKDFDKLKGRNFAVIIDEAHQGQSGESARTLRSSLIDAEKEKKAFAEENDMNPDAIEETEELLNILGQGHHENQSFFAFTATPINKTLELFGTSIGDEKKKPFHTYSMRQAIEEGFILDVLSTYVTIKEAFKLITNTEDNPELLEEKAKRALFKYYKQHEFTISQKVDMIMDNFLNNGRKKINGHGKAMIVTDSRQSAVLYYQAVKEYLSKHPDETKGCGVLVAFSGKVKFDGDDTEYIEAEMNEYPDGKKINSDAKFRKAFKSDDFNIMVVADKYQTGYDEPLLHSMFVDKKLKGVNAVQTLSRLNRTCPFKNDTFVLDFANTSDSIKESFQPLMSRNIDRLIKYIASKSIEVSIITNGYYLDDSFIERHKNQISTIGISVDSLDYDTNVSIGRCFKANTLSKEQLIHICNSIKKAGIKLKINTCLSKLNIDEDFNSFINEIKPDRYKILQMHCDDNDIRNKNDMVNKEEAKTFLSKIKFDHMYESSDEMKNSYIIIDSQGNISTNNAHISDISIFDYDLEEAINLLNIDYANYIKRYI